ncbi:MAG: hypothetical protein KY455_09140 [Euryarchaeota archaeon]|nr:hypothetical protein [Euryarchaeota archaeon]
MNSTHFSYLIPIFLLAISLSGCTVEDNPEDPYFFAFKSVYKTRDSSANVTFDWIGKQWILNDAGSLVEAYQLDADWASTPGKITIWLDEDFIPIRADQYCKDHGTRDCDHKKIWFGLPGTYHLGLNIYSAYKKDEPIRLEFVNQTFTIEPEIHRKGDIITIKIAPESLPEKEGATMVGEWEFREGSFLPLRTPRFVLVEAEKTGTVEPLAIQEPRMPPTSPEYRFFPGENDRILGEGVTHAEIIQEVLSHDDKAVSLHEKGCLSRYEMRTSESPEPDLFDELFGYTVIGATTQFMDDRHAIEWRVAVDKKEGEYSFTVSEGKAVERTADCDASTALTTSIDSLIDCSLQYIKKRNPSMTVSYMVHDPLAGFTALQTLFTPSYVRQDTAGVQGSEPYGIMVDAVHGSVRSIEGHPDDLVDLEPCEGLP